LVLSEIQEWPDFIETYYSNYYSQKEWSKKLKNIGFIQIIENYSKPSNINWYYSLFQKPDLKRKFDQIEK